MITMEEMAARMTDLMEKVCHLENRTGGITGMVTAIKKLLLANGGGRIVELHSQRGALLGLTWTHAGRNYTLNPQDISEGGWEGQLAWLRYTAAHAPLGLHGTLVVYSVPADRLFSWGPLSRHPVVAPSLAAQILATGKAATAAHPSLLAVPVQELAQVPALIEALAARPDATPDQVAAAPTGNGKQPQTPRSRTRRVKAKETA